MVGENVSAKDRLARVEKLIEEYEARKGVIPLKAKNDADIYINMSKENMKALTPEECGEACVVIAQYAAYLQEVYNKENSRINWIDAEIRRCITPDMKQYNSPSAEERKALATFGNEYTAELDKLRNWARALADRVSFIANRVDAIGKAYQVLLQTKRRTDGRERLA